MATALLTRPLQSDRTERVLLDGIRWSTYEALLEDLGDRHIRLTYDRGSLEIMTVSPAHEFSKSSLARMIETLTLELNIPIRTGGSQTCRSQLKEKGLEPDECYWVEHEPLIRGKSDIDLEQDPPPDIAVEIEISRSVLDRLGIYAALRVPEVWRYDGRTLEILQLRIDQSYATVEISPSFPWLPMARFRQFLAESGGTIGETHWIRSFRAWVRAEVAPLAPEFLDEAE
jgi:Uma2 family endonuclease